MKRLLTLLLGLSGFLCAAPLWAENPRPAGMSVGHIDPAQSKAHLQVERLDGTRTHIRLASPEIKTEEHWLDYQRLHSFTIEGEALLPAEERPTVPQVARLYQIPNRGQVHVELENLKYDVVDNIDVLPLKLETPAFGQLARDGRVYDQNAWYPEEIAVLSTPAIFRDLRVVQLALYPVQINPVTRQARIYRNLEAQLVATDDPGENEILNPGPLTGSYVPMYRQAVANLDETQLATATQTPGTYLILYRQHEVGAPAIVEPFVDSLFTWKTRKGHRVIVEGRTSWSVTDMKNTIRVAWETYEPKLEFVCIMGDPNASGFAMPTNGSYDGEFDHGFALLAGDDQIEDIGVGRLSGTNGLQMAIINSKIMHYERNPYVADTTWFHKGYFLAGVANTIASNYTLMQWAAQQFRTWTGVTSTTVQTVDGAVIPSNVVAQFDGGISYFFWRGSWLSQMSTTLAGSTNPGWRLPICLCVTCGANEFTSDLGIAESYLVAGESINLPRGGVASIGTSTSGTHAPQNITFAGGLIYAIANQAIEHLGHALSAGKVWLVMTYGMQNQNTINFSNWNNLMGDPGLSMWTDVPDELTVDHPAALNVGAGRVAVTVRRTADNAPVENALVVLWKRRPDSTWVQGFTDATGQIALPVSVRAEGELYLTITKRNHVPYLATLPCTAAQTPLPMLSTYTIDDDNSGGSIGNANHQVNPGETIDLPVWVRNFGGGAPITGATATLVSNNPHVTVTQGTAGLAPLVPGDSAQGAPPFRVQVSTLMQAGEVAQLTLTVTSIAGATQSLIPLTCRAGAIGYISHVVSGNHLNPGISSNLTVTIVNNGQAPLNGVIGRLHSLSPFMQVIDGEGLYGTVGSGGQSTNFTNPFTVQPHPLAYRGHVARMYLVANTVDGQADTAYFSLTVSSNGTFDPTGPDEFGYFAYDHMDQLYELHPIYNYINISAGGLGTSLNLNDSGEKNDYRVPPTSTVRRLPFSFKFYGQVYDSITICSNGWCAFGNQAWNDNFRNYRIPAMQAPQAMIAPYWQDLCTTGPAGSGVWEYYQAENHRYIIQWKGAELITGETCPPSLTLDFEVILYDTTFHPTYDGNGKVLVQYQAVPHPTLVPEEDYGEPVGFSVGIQDQRGLVGLSYCHYDPLALGGYGWAPHATPLTAASAILFTTETRRLYGDVQGTVRDAGTNAPLPGVEVSLDGFSYSALTNENGAYQLQDVFIGDYTLRAQLHRYNDATVANIPVRLDSTTTIDLTLQYPSMVLSVATLNDSTRGEVLDTTFEILNPGTGPLDYSIQIRYAGDETANPWDSVGAIAVTGITNDYQIQGCEFAGDSWWVTGGSGPGGQNVIYKFDLAGNLCGQIPQPSTTSVGWFDLAWDGHLLWGSDGPYLIGIDTLGNVVDSIPSPMNPSRAIAFDPLLRHFWVTDYTQDIYEIDTTGNYGTPYSNSGAGELTITGLAWDATEPSGYRLYIFSQNGAGRSRVSRLNPATRHVQSVIDLPGETGDAAGGCTITGAWNSTLLVFAGVLQNPAGDRLEMFEMAFNTTWVTVAPAIDVVPAAGARAVAVHLNPETLLRNGRYQVDLRIASEVYDTTMVLPINLVVDRPAAAVPDPENRMPRQFALYQNYPNPFNPATQIRFDLPRAARVRLEVFNTLGQLVAVLADETRSAGSYSLTWDGRSRGGLDVSSGLYFVRLQAGDFVQSRKMLLMK